LAERNLYSAELIEDLLRTEGYEVVIALDAEEAIAVCEARLPDLAFVELVISGGSGVDLCSQLSSLGATVVAVSALAIGPDAIDAGAAAFLLKPLVSREVLSTVKDLVGQLDPDRHSAKGSVT
jgi:DNA-binding response OmpR family regulator